MKKKVKVKMGVKKQSSRVSANASAKKSSKTQATQKAVQAKSSFPIQPLSDKVLVKVDDTNERTLPSGIIIPETAKQEKSDRGTVVAVGPGRVDENGKRIAMEVRVGDKVLFQWGDKLEFEGEEYYLVGESSVSAIIV
jgi:chaperonin GroES